ncbi:cytochrome b/b6 domain-containing protein [Noviherbaspirillum aridicola]|uniref:Cytochrome b561 n=1 Tax=Noviherbaspirillum aridicola TaxID=2849687 RepID=A0ABQ4Q7I8_9BURK|nr:cytochrome b/b6 domain-containing protein [Noviherbaspirillum aridicola]GIZ52956.1 cytochrome b561 [Noviherbaspirillum aridicola]
MKKVRVWDLPLRLFHWTLAVLIIVAVVTQNIGGNAMEWHFRAGYAVLALLLFRVLWGFVGSRYARFASFVYGPSSIVGYLRGRGRHDVGHNPLGALSVFALLGVLLMQAAGGMFANDDIASEGPLAKFISKEVSDQITWLHTEVGALLIYVLVGLHVLAILYYRIVRRRNLVRAMITGDQEVDAEAPAANDSWGMRLLAALLLAASAGFVWYLVTLPPKAYM